MFTIRVFHSNVIFMLGPEANHYMTVSHAANFSWRRGFMGDLIPLLGDGLLTIDGDFHRQSRKIMLPAFHRERIEAAHAIMTAETQQALDASERRHAVRPLPLHARAGAADRDARALRAGPRSGARRRHQRGATSSSRRWASGRATTCTRSCAGPGSPWRRMVAARRRLDALIFAEIDRRRAQR